MYTQYPNLTLGFHGCRKAVYDDWLIRDLDCAVINQIHEVRKEAEKEPFSSVRGIFTEGKPIYPGAGFRGKTHVQLCIRSMECIKGYFSPLNDEGLPVL